MEVAEALRAIETPDVGPGTSTNHAEVAPAPVEPLESSNDPGVLNMFNHVPITVRQKIWNGEFIELRSLLPKHNDSTLQKVQVVKGEIIVSVKGFVKNFDKIEMWTNAYLIYMGETCG